MPDLLEQFARDTIEELLKRTPAAELRKHLSLEERLTDVSADELLAALSPETRAALVQRVKSNDALLNPGDK
jgi:hypothetical protein